MSVPNAKTSTTICRAGIEYSCDGALLPSALRRQSASNGESELCSILHNCFAFKIPFSRGFKLWAHHLQLCRRNKPVDGTCEVSEPMPSQRDRELDKIRLRQQRKRRTHKLLNQCGRFIARDMCSVYDFIPFWIAMKLLESKIGYLSAWKWRFMRQCQRIY